MRENKNIGSELDATALRIRGGGRRLVAAVIIDIIAALAVIVFGVLLWSSGLLPLKFFIPLCVILLLLCGVLTILSLGGRHLLRPTLGMIFNLLLALACVLGSYMVTKGVDTLRDIIGKRESSNHVGIYVRTDDPAKDLQDLESYAFGILGDEDRENTDKAIAELEKTLGDGKKISYTEYKNKFSMVSDLLSGKLGVVFLNSSYIDVISDVEGFENLGSKLREVYSVRVVSDKTDNKTDIKQPSDRLSRRRFHRIYERYRHAQRIPCRKEPLRLEHSCRHKLQDQERAAHLHPPRLLRRACAAGGKRCQG